KVICFVSHGTSAESYKDILELMTTRFILRPGHEKRHVKEGLSKYRSLESVLLLLRGIKINLHPDDDLDVEADVVIYWGVPPETLFVKRMSTVGAQHTYVILSNFDDSATRRRVTTRSGMREHPESTQVNLTGPGTLLHSYRDRTWRAMGTIPSSVADKLYADHVIKVKKALKIPMKDSIIRANQFAARVLLHGEAEDGSSLYPPIRTRPSMKQKQVVKFGLQPYISQGLMKVD
ncbi:unnamed protein product, partial [Rhizoctonia solani]